MSGGGSSNSYDAAYNARIATLMEEESARGAERYEWEKQHYQPYEEEMIAANRSLLPYQTANALALQQNVGNLIDPTFAALEKGLNVEGQVGAAVSDVYSAFDKADAQKKTDALRMGIDPTSNAWATKTNNVDRAKAEGQTRFAARNTLEQQNLANLMKGLQL